MGVSARTSLAVLTAAVALAGTSGTLPAPVAVEISATSPQQEQDAEWALARFRMAGLATLPRRHQGLNGVEFVFHGGNQFEADKLIQALDRFSDAGLELPSLDILFAAGCQDRFGAWGRFQMFSSTPPWRIEVCTTNVYLHELAHAWDRWNLTDEDRRMVLDLVGLDFWRGSDVPWAQRGEEELARLIARVLGQGVNNHPSEEQLTDFDHFERITGVSPPVVRVFGADRSPPY